jgi:hypothetical protein
MAVVPNSNTRVFYATQAVTIGGIGNTADPIDSWQSGDCDQTGAHTIVHGLQSIGVDTNFNLEQAFELGQLSLYENIEDIPDISVSMQKFLDGYSLLYHLGASFDDTVSATDSTQLALTKTTLSGRADTRADIRMIINETSEEAVTSGDEAVAELYCSGMYLSSVSYTIPTDGTCTEDVTFVGNSKKWINDPATYDNLLLDDSALSKTGVHEQFGSIFGSDEPNAPGAHVLRREDVVTTASGLNGGAGGYSTVVPSIIEGVATPTEGLIVDRIPTNAGLVNTDNVHIVSFSCSTDLGREQINQLGTRTPYNRYVTFPTEVTSTIEMTATAGDNVDAVEDARTNLLNHEICMVLGDSTVIHLGKKNKLASITYGGGDAGGGNATITYNFSNFNDMVVLHSGDPIRGANESTAATGYWADKFA